jgi:hypothetical protein
MMFGIFKKKNIETVHPTMEKSSGEKTSNSSNSISNLAPPKNLPELAKDLFGATRLEKMETPHPTENIVANLPPAFVPKSDQPVPKLDLNLLREQQALNKSMEIRIDPRSNASREAYDFGRMQDYIRIILKEELDDFFKTARANNYPLSSNNTQNTINMHELMDLARNLASQKMTNANPSILASPIIPPSTPSIDINANTLYHLRSYVADKQNLMTKLFETIDAEIVYNSLREHNLQQGFGSPLSNNLNTLYNTISPLSNLSPSNSSEPQQKSHDLFNLFRRKEHPVQQTPPVQEKNVQNSQMQLLVDSLNLANASIVDPSKFFYAQDGSVIKSLKDLSASLLSMNDAVFNHHVTNERNDFANWINDVFNLSKLAIEISAIHTRKDLITYLFSLGL